MESYSSRGELLAIEQFDTLLEAQVLVADWPEEYNGSRYATIVPTFRRLGSVRNNAPSRQMRALAQGAALHRYRAWAYACAAVVAIAECETPLIDARRPPFGTRLPCVLRRGAFQS